VFEEDVGKNCIRKIERLAGGLGRKRKMTASLICHAALNSRRSAVTTIVRTKGTKTLINFNN
jgi:hypothetical protein